MVIDYLSPHLYIVDFLFSNIPGKYENVVFIIKNPRNRKKSNSQIITIKTYYEKSTIYKCGER